MIKPQRVVDLLCELAPPLIAKRYSVKAGSCIASTAIGLRVCKHFGIDARPLPVFILVGNEAFRLWCEAGCPELTDEELQRPGAPRCVEIDTNHKQGGYPAHLVIWLPDQRAICDLSLGQFRRPDKQINLPDSGLFQGVSDEFWQGKVLCYQKNGLLMEIDRLTDPPPWHTSPDWQRTHPLNEVAKKVIRQIERRLTTGESNGDRND